MSSHPRRRCSTSIWHPASPPMLRVATAGDPPSWAAEHRDALRAVVAEHGSVLVRGLGLRDAAEVGAVFRRLADRPDDREGGLRAPADLRRRRVLLDRRGRRTSRCACTTS